MKPFDLEKAKSGEFITTRNGRKVRIFAYDLLSGAPIIGAVKMANGFEQVLTWDNTGRVASFEDDTAFDLCMASVMETRRVYSVVGPNRWSDRFYLTMSDAQDACGDPARTGLQIITLEYSVETTKPFDLEK